MGLIHRLDLDKVTFGELYRFVDHARAAGIPDDQQITVEAEDEVGNPMDTHVLVADLGDVDEITRPVLIDSRDASLYADAVGNVLTQSNDRSDDEALSRLHNELLGLPPDYQG
ncbi:hypothetical protein [Amycolatopsis taiwanensis]|uniref:Uncharacterized protein n=1 Tax=Amycolatopsis taiwanensis TaxID=342230 RepID=A0A9W6VIT4_9PSEU|nr:hypothetical protein [Amycolatopsis taiwanensis]GLY68782.1 hypothetical protein Atai01_54010 [Amycolatopsis taiwanensis]